MILTLNVLRDEDWATALCKINFFLIVISQISSAPTNNNSDDKWTTWTVFISQFCRLTDHSKPFLKHSLILTLLAVQFPQGLPSKVLRSSHITSNHLVSHSRPECHHLRQSKAKKGFIQHFFYIATHLELKQTLMCQISKVSL